MLHSRLVMIVAQNGGAESVERLWANCLKGRGVRNFSFQRSEGPRLEFGGIRRYIRFFPISRPTQTALRGVVFPSAKQTFSTTLLGRPIRRLLNILLLRFEFVEWHGWFFVFVYMPQACCSDEHRSVNESFPFAVTRVLGWHYGSYGIFYFF